MLCMGEDLLKGILWLFGLLVLAVGFWGAMEYAEAIVRGLLQMLVNINYSVYESFGESLLSGVFKHFITYKIVGLILSTGIAGGSVFLGKWIGKIAYAIVIIGVVAMLNFIAILIG